MNHGLALVIEADESIARLNKHLLEIEGFTVDVARTAGEGERLAGNKDYSVIILDLLLPDGDGITLLRTIRERDTTTPVLIVSGEPAVGNTVTALDAGADDYLEKPYHAEELRARLRALLRRGHRAKAAIIGCGNVTLHRMERQATIDDERLHLTPREFALLEHFVINRGKTLTRNDLLEKVWRFSFDPGTNIVDVNVARLRAKLFALGANCRLETQRGLGYVMIGG